MATQYPSVPSNGNGSEQPSPPPVSSPPVSSSPVPSCSVSRPPISRDPVSPQGASQSGGVAPGDENRSSSAGRWLAALRTIVGLESPTLRDTIEDALKSDGGVGEDTFTSQEREMLLRLLRYNALRVEDVMVPRADIIAVDESDSVAEALQTFVDAGVSRMPLFRESLDDPRGMIHIKDVVSWLTRAAVGASGQADPVPRPAANQTTGGRKSFPKLDLSRVALDQTVASAQIGRAVIFVPPSMPAMNLLLRMQSTRRHMALVVDEYGGTDGLVTIEDLIEQIVGQIEDEHDEDEERNIIQDAGPGMIAAARTPVDELEALLGLDLALDEDDDVDTLGGLVFALARSVPVRGEIVRHPAGIELEVLEADPRRIKRLRITRPEPSDHDGTPSARLPGKDAG